MRTVQLKLHDVGLAINDTITADILVAVSVHNNAESTHTRTMPTEHEHIKNL